MQTHRRAIEHASKIIFYASAAIQKCSSSSFSKTIARNREVFQEFSFKKADKCESVWCPVCVCTFILPSFLGELFNNKTMSVRV